MESAYFLPMVCLCHSQTALPLLNQSDPGGLLHIKGLSEKERGREEGWGRMPLFWVNSSVSSYRLLLALH